MSTQTSKIRTLSLWSFLRNVLSQGRDIYLDHEGKGYEEYSARLDAAARERADELERALGSANETESKPGVREVLHGLQLCTCRDGARYRFLRQGEDMLDTEQEERFAQMWRDISRKGIWREKMDTRIDQAMQEQEANSHHRGEVMNPPASAAPGAEAGNLESLVEQFNDGHTPPDHD